MDIVLNNTLTREKSVFKPIEDKKVKIYSCGPTVYDYAHIGNMRSYIFMDLLGRVLRFNGYETVTVMNITDLGHLVSDGDEGEDKMLKGARKLNKTPWEIAELYTAAFLKDIDSLNVVRPDYMPKATEHIDCMIEFVAGLVDKGYAYETAGGVYFDVRKFDGYGKLSRQSLEDQLAGARVDINTEKRHPSDFAVWIKAPKEHIMQWPSPWGMGYPGWHIECSAMSRQYLGDVFDIHTGGVDHIPVHHENEIAQSEALLGKPAVNCWMHGEFLMVDGGRMGKSLGNLYTIEDLRQKGYDPLTYRYFCLNAHYSTKLNFTWDAMNAAVVSYKRFIEGAAAHKNAGDNGGAVEAEAGKFKEEFLEAVNDDLNIPKALGAAWNVVRNPVKSTALYKLLLEMDEIFGLKIEENTEAGRASEPIDPEVQELCRLRGLARADKDWKKSDELRDSIKALGYNVLDTKEGMKIEKI